MNTYRVHVEVEDPDHPGGRTLKLPTRWVEAKDEHGAAVKVGIALSEDQGYGANDIVSAVAVLETN